MAVLFMLLMFAAFLGIDFARKTHAPLPRPTGTMYTTPGYEFLGALAQDGGEPFEDTFKGEGI